MFQGSGVSKTIAYRVIFLTEESEIIYQRRPLSNYLKTTSYIRGHPMIFWIIPYQFIPLSQRVVEILEYYI